MYRGGGGGGVSSTGGGVNNLNGASGGRRQVLSSVDFYRRVPKDLTEVRLFVWLRMVQLRYMVVL
jgi:hypothetical protein